MTKVNAEHVLAFPTATLHRIGYFQGISFDVKPYFDELLRPGTCRFVPRDEAEHDPSQKQLIPYALLCAGDTVFSYRRGKLLAEKRLLGKYSIGVGGHISATDENLFGTSYAEGMERELNEEVELPPIESNQVVALLNDDRDEVGQVHFGVIHVVRLANTNVQRREKSINEPQFLTVDDLQSRRSEYEGWSQICIDALPELLRRTKRRQGTVVQP